jgi:transcriptional regulator with XRE-family HTH domain
MATEERHNELRLDEQAMYWREGAITEFTEDVCRLMAENGISRAELARTLGTSRAYISKLLGGNANFSLATMARVATAVQGILHVRVEGIEARRQRLLALASPMANEVTDLNIRTKFVLNLEVQTIGTGS